MNLYELAKEWNDAVGAITDEDFAEALNRISNLKIDIHRKIENTVKAIRNLEGESLAAKEEAKRLSERASMFAGESRRLRLYLARMMRECEVKKSKSSLATVSLREGSPRVVVEDESKVPDKFVEVEEVRKIRKREISDHIKATGEIPDGIDWVVGESTITIR